MPLYVPSASLPNAVEPGRGVTPGGTAVILTVLVPDFTLTGGFGFAFVSRKKKFAIRSPQLSEIRSIFVIVATAPLVFPIILDPLVT